MIEQVIDSRKVTFIEDKVKGIRPEDKQVDLVMRRGAAHLRLLIDRAGQRKRFRHPGTDGERLLIRNIDSVRMIREHIEYMFAKYRNEEQRDEYVTIVVGGAGFTGVEFVGELVDRMPQPVQGVRHSSGEGAI